MIDDEGTSFITRRESVTEPPNLVLRQYCPPGRVCTAMAYRNITDFKDPTPQLRDIKKQLVRYKRADGVDLSFTLYLPPGYDAAQTKGEQWLKEQLAALKDRDIAARGEPGAYQPRIRRGSGGG